MPNARAAGLFPPAHPGLSLPRSKQRKVLAQRSGQARWSAAGMGGRSGLGRQGRTVGPRNAGGPRPRSACPASPREGAAGSAHRKGRQEALSARSCTSVSLAPGTLPSLLPGASLCEERARARKGGGENGEEVPPRILIGGLRTPFGGATSGKERKRRVGGGVVKMAAPLRIQSDWAQALR